MIRGYAARFDTLTRPGNRVEPLIVKAGAFDLFGSSIFLQFDHGAPVYSATRDGNLRVWQDGVHALERGFNAPRRTDVDLLAEAIEASGSDPVAVGTIRMAAELAGGILE